MGVGWGLHFGEERWGKIIKINCKICCEMGFLKEEERLDALF